MHISVDRSTLEKLLHQAASAALLVGHLDDPAHAELIDQIGDRIDAVAHGLNEILGEARTLAARDAAAPDVAHDGAPMLTADAGGAR